MFTVKFAYQPLGDPAIVAPDHALERVETFQDVVPVRFDGVVGDLELLLRRP